ncbi:MAG: helix-turn-helix domain-containing protein, partial [Planctomycetota bacterium]
MHNELVPIGQFSKLTGLTVKTLRFYHESGVLEPASVDSDSGYRYYSMEQVETARAIKVLRDLEFPIREVAEILSEAEPRGGLVALLQKRRQRICEALQEEKERLARLDQIIAMEQQGESHFEASHFEVERKTLAPLLIASIRHQGSYADSSKLFPKIG